MKKQSINLLQRPDYGQGTLGNVSNWALTVGRWIVVITELVVIGAFLFRFSLDQQIAVLKEGILEKRNIIIAAEPQEMRFREVQKRLGVLAIVLQQSKDYGVFLKELNKSVPDGVAVDAYSTVEQLDDPATGGTVSSQILIKGLAISQEPISRFISNLQTSEHFTNVQLLTIAQGEANIQTSDDENSLSFSIIADLIL